MLKFFRKYQRYFFVVIAIVIVISFSFFGTHQSIATPKETEDRVLGVAVDGSQMRKKDIDEIGRFLWSDRMDMQLSEKRITPNFFNNGVIRKDFFATGLGVMLVDQYFDELSEEFQHKVEKHKKFRPYQHPTASFISVENLWSQLLPVQKANLDKFLYEDLPVDSSIFSLLVDLYLGETAFPSSTLREYLMFQQKHYNWIQPDQALPHTNLNLFQAASVEDWFGPKFLQLISQFVHNVAMIAKEKGYSVSKEEARVDLFRNGYEALQMQKRSEKIDQTDLGNLWKQQLLHLGMDEKIALRVWQKVMLMRRLFEDYGHAALLDCQQYQAFHSYASKTALVDLYHLPEALQLNNFHTLLKLIYYCDAIGYEQQKGHELPQTFKSINEMEQKHPELIQKRFLVEVAEVKKDDIAQNVSLKEMWEWQLEPNNFNKLQEEFPELAVSKATDAESYFIAFEKMDPQIRQKLDHYSRLEIVHLHPEWITEALNDESFEKKEIAIAPNGAQVVLEGVDNAQELMHLLSNCGIKGELKSCPEAMEAQAALSCYSADQKTYYCFHVLDRDEEMNILTFAEANVRGLLDMLVDQELENHYLKVRKQNPTPFKTESDEWKPFEEVKNEVGQLVYKDVLQGLDREYAELKGELDLSHFDNLNAFYPMHYLYQYMQMAQSDIRTHGNESSYLAKPHYQIEDTNKLVFRDPLSDQWKIITEKKNHKNYESSPWFDETIFAMVEKGWSSVKVPQDGKLHFFQLQEKQVPEETYLHEIKKGREVLSVEAQRFLMVEVLEELKAKQAIHFFQTQDVE